MYDYSYYQNALQTPSLNTRLKGIFTACSWRSRRPHSELSNTLCKRQAAAFVLSMFKINAATWSSRWSQCLHSVSTAIHSVAGDCSARTSAICSFFERCWNVVRAPLWFDGAFRKNVYYKSSHALVSWLVSPRESKNPVIKIIMFSVIKINNFVFNF